MPEKKIISTGADDTGKRLDLFLSRAGTGLSRNRIQDLIRDGKIKVNGRIEKRHYRLRKGDGLQVEIPDPVEIPAKPEKIPLKILYEDESIIVIDKPAGMVTHPAAGNYTGTLVNALLYHCKNLSGINGRLRPGIVHRLDKDTSGVMVAAKNDAAHSGLVKQWQEGSVLKKYTALVKGRLEKNEMTIEAPICRHKVQRKKMAVNLSKGKTAVSKIKVLERFKDASLIEVEIKTGRTHQIRVHLSYLRHPVIGDAQYGKKSDIINRQALHAAELGFTHPATGKYMRFSSEMPYDMKKAVGLVKRPS